MKTWNGIREVINIRTKETIFNYVSDQFNNTTITDSKLIANLFNNHFTSIAQNMEQKITTSKSKHSDYLKNPCQQTFFLTPLNEQEVLQTSIPDRFSKLFQKELSKPMSLIINLSFLTGTSLVILKIANVISFFKKKDPSLCTNHRPISLLSNLSKIIETLVHKRASNFLTEQNALYEKQFGFRSNRSTMHAITKLTEKIRQASDSGQFVCDVVLDLQKTFDTDNHNIL